MRLSGDRYNDAQNLQMTRPPGMRGLEPTSSSAELERRILGSSGWVALGLGGRQLASFLSLLVLARLLEPADFGLAVLAWTVLAFAEQIQETGIGQALIHRRTEVDQAAASALVFSPALGLLLYAAVFLAAPLLAEFLRAPGLTDVLRVMALVLVLRGIAVVPGALLERDLDFRSRTYAELHATVAQVVVSLTLAFSGAGVWSLVFGHLAGGAAQTIVYWSRAHLRPSLGMANRRVLRELLQYGRFVGAFNVLTVVSNTVDDIVVGRVLGTSSVGVYSVVYRLAHFPSAVLGNILGRPMFSIYSTLQEDLPSFRFAYVRNLQRVALVAVPVSVGIAVAAEPIVAALLGDKWLGGVNALHVLAVYGLFKIFGGLTSEALKGLGKPGWNLVFGVVYAAVVLPSLVVLTPTFGITGAAVAMLIAVATSAVPALLVTWRALHVSAADVARALAPSFLCSTLLAIALTGLLVSTTFLSPAARLMVLVAGGLAVYVGATAIFARSIVASTWASLRSGRQASLSPSD
jgi:O-antigen/teichoic acid export membrane protein